MTYILLPKAQKGLRDYLFHVTAVTGARAAILEQIRVESELTKFASAAVDGTAVTIRDWPRQLRRHFIHPFHVYYERHPDVLYVVRLWHHARRPIER
jgi:plasmid stabilization system protein ParE